MIQQVPGKTKRLGFHCTGTIDGGILKLKEQAFNISAESKFLINKKANKMKHQTTKKLFAFITAIMMFSIMPVIANAQNKLNDKSSGNSRIKGGWCNCNKRPIPFSCGQLCGWRTTTVTNNPGSQSYAVSFYVDMPENIAVKIFDMTGRLVKALADKTFEQGEHKLQWDAAGINDGIYIVQLNAGAYSETKKIAVIK